MSGATRTRCHVVMVALSVALVAGPANAVEIGAEGDVASVEVHAFASQGFILSTHNNYLSAGSTDGSFQYSEIGINFTKTLTDNLRVGLQLFAQDLGRSGSFNANVDWFYLDYRWKDWLGFRAGRVKIPFGLYNEVNDADAARVPILLPQSVYPIENTNYLLAQTGAGLYGYLKSRHAGALEYRAYGGTILLGNLVLPSSPYRPPRRRRTSSAATTSARTVTYGSRSTSQRSTRSSARSASSGCSSTRRPKRRDLSRFQLQVSANCAPGMVPEEPGMTPLVV